MKEYLEPVPNGNYRYHKDEGCMIGGDWIEIPEGAEIAFKSIIDGVLNFTKYDWMWEFSKTKGLYKRYCKLSDSYKENVVWQRHTQPEELPFVDDGPATYVQGTHGLISDTLNERRSQYGDFKDVATTTQNLLYVLQEANYEGMPPQHREAMHMICSKMARLVNGDFDHKDSWHDISGYATLVERSIK